MIMDNIKKFEDFLDKMRGLLDNAKKQGHIIVRVEDLESTFPELNESEDSEDERIMKALLEMVHDTTGDELWIDYNIHKEDALAWFEKQSKQKPEWSEEDEEMLKLLKALLNEASCYSCTEGVDKILSWFKSLKDRVQPKQEWNEEDEKMIQSLIQNQEILIGYTTNEQLRDIYAKEIDWLKSLHNNLKKLKEK